MFPDHLSDFQLVEKVKIHREPKASISCDAFSLTPRFAPYIVSLMTCYKVLRDSGIQNHLLAEPDLTLKKAVSAAQAAEIANTGVKELSMCHQ